MGRLWAGTNGPAVAAAADSRWPRGPSWSVESSIRRLCPRPPRRRAATGMRRRDASEGLVTLRDGRVKRCAENTSTACVSSRVGFISFPRSGRGGEGFDDMMTERLSARERSAPGEHPLLQRGVLCPPDQIPRGNFPEIQVVEPKLQFHQPSGDLLVRLGAVGEGGGGAKRAERGRQGAHGVDAPALLLLLRTAFVENEADSALHWALRCFMANTGISTQLARQRSSSLRDV